MRMFRSVPDLEAVPPNSKRMKAMYSHTETEYIQQHMRESMKPKPFVMALNYSPRAGDKGFVRSRKSHQRGVVGTSLPTQLSGASPPLRQYAMNRWQTTSARARPY